MFRLMGGDATASIGAVIAHFQAPLARVLADLRRAEKRAKGEGGRDAFWLTLTKRASGTTHLVGKWRLDAGLDGDMGLLIEARDLIARSVSRQVVYLLTEKLRDLPAEGLESMLRYQFNRQARAKEDEKVGAKLAARLAAAAAGRRAMEREPEWPGPNRWLRDLLLTAEFLAWEGRIGVEEKDDACIP